MAAKFLSRDPTTAVGGGQVGLPPDDAFAGRYPALWEFLTLERWDDGKPRKSGTVLLFIEAGLWKSCLNDRDGGRVAFAAAATQEALLQAVEGQLQGGRVEWRKSRAR